MQRQATKEDFEKFYHPEQPSEFRAFEIGYELAVYRFGGIPREAGEGRAKPPAPVVGWIREDGELRPDPEIYNERALSLGTPILPEAVDKYSIYWHPPTSTWCWHTGTGSHMKNKHTWAWMRPHEGVNNNV